MRGFLELFFILAVGLGLGGALSRLSIENNLGFGSQTIGQWTAWPQAGSRDADPYTKAKVAADGVVPLGAAEGVAFHGRADNQGKPLQLECFYTISGQTPPARLWTLTAHKINGETVRTSSGSPSALVSRNIIRKTDGEFLIHVGPVLRSGNWLETSGDGDFEFIFRLYDSQIASASGLVEPKMPQIILSGCKT